MRKPSKAGGRRKKNRANQLKKSTTKSKGAKNSKAPKKRVIERSRTGRPSHVTTEGSSISALDQTENFAPSNHLVTNAPRTEAMDASQDLQEQTTDAPRKNIDSTPAGTF